MSEPRDKRWRRRSVLLDPITFAELHRLRTAMQMSANALLRRLMRMPPPRPAGRPLKERRDADGPSEN